MDGDSELEVLSGEIIAAFEEVYVAQQGQG
jgi:hypothetical protein